jgi:NitT/TauT family transport system substrate-binding protein
MGSPAVSVHTASRRWRPLLALGVGASLLVGCGGGGDDAGSAGGGASETGGGGGPADEVTFLNVVPIESLSFVTEMYAQCSGLFEEQNLDVRFEATQGSSQAINTVIAGSALLTRIGDIETISAIANQDAPLVNVGVHEKEGTIRIMSAESDPLEKPEDFAGKLMGLPSVGGTSEQTLDLMLSVNGVDKADVQRQVTGLAPGVFDLVDSGRIAGYIVSADTAISLQAQRPNAVAMNPAEYMSGGSQLYATSKEQAEDPEKADQVRRYLQAIADASVFIQDDEANDFQETLDCITEDFEVAAAENREAAVESLKLYVAGFMSEGRELLLQTNADRWQTLYDEMVEADLAPAGQDPQEWLSAEFAPEVSE